MEPASNRIYVRLLGDVRFSTQSICVTEFPTRKTVELAAFLVCNDRSVHQRLDIADLLWPNIDPESSRNRLKQAIAALKRLFRPIENFLGQDALIVTRTTIRSTHDIFAPDTNSFLLACKKAFCTRNTYEQRPLLVEAERSYGGRFLPGIDTDWVWLERQRLEEDYTNVLCLLSKSYRTTGDFAIAREYALKAVKTDPLSDECRREMIVTHIAMDSRSAAIKNYREFERLLREYYGYEPEAETRELLAGIDVRPAQI